MGELRAFLKNLKPDYRGGLSRSFEDMALHMFMCELGLDVPPLRHTNQKGIEADPVHLYQSGSYAFQAKHYDEKTELKDKKGEFIKSVRDAKTYGVTDLYFYVNKDLGQDIRNRGQDADGKFEKDAQHPDPGTGKKRQRGSGKKEGSLHLSEIKNWFIRDYRSDFQRSVEEEAAARPSMKVHWRTIDKIENLLVKEKYGYIRRVYLANEGESDLFGYYQSVAERVHRCDEEDSLYGNISLLEGYIEPRIRERGSGNGNRAGNASGPSTGNPSGNIGGCLSVREYLESWVRGKSEWISIICGEPGHGKTSLCQKAVHDFYVDKWLAGTVRNVFCASINPAGSKAEQDIRTTGRFSLDSLLSWGRKGATVPEDSQYIREEDLKNALLFLDGFDELLEWLPGYGMDKFLQTVSGYIFSDGFQKNERPHIVITTRKMAISDDKVCYRDYERKMVIPVWELQFIEEEQQYGWIRKHSEKLRLDYGIPIQESCAGFGEQQPDAGNTGQKPCTGSVGPQPDLGGSNQRPYIERYKEMYAGLDDDDKDDRDLKDILGVPVIFRMIVAGGYIPKRGSHPATIYDELFLKTWMRHNVRESHVFDDQNQHHSWDKDVESVKRILSGHALRVYADNGDSAEIDGNLEGAASSWIYAFYTKFKGGEEDPMEDGRKDTDLEAVKPSTAGGGGDVRKGSAKGRKYRVGFLHKSFYEYFLAYEILAWLRDCGKDGRIVFFDGEDVEFSDMLFILGKQKLSEAVLKSIKNLYEMIQESAWHKSIGDAGFEAAYEIARRTGGILSIPRHTGAYFTRCSEKGADGGRAAEKGVNFQESIWELLSDIAALFEKDEDPLKRGGNVFWNILSVCSVCGHPLKCGAVYEKYLRTYDLAEIHLENAELGWAKTKEACFCGEHFGDAEAEAAHLKGAVLSGAHLEGALLGGTHLEGAVLSGAHLENAHLFGAHLEGADLSGAYLTEADFEGANLKHANLGSSHCEKAVMSGAVLEDAVLNYAHLEGAFLNGAYLDEAVYDENDKVCRGASVGRFAWDGIYLAGGGLKADLQGAFLSPEQVRCAISAGSLKASEMPDCIEVEKASGNSACRIYVTRGEETKCIDLSAFGSYWQEPDKPKMPLAWRLLRLEGNKALITTEKIIDCHKYHNERKGVTWADSEIRDWLNHGFLEEAFTDEERGRIAVVCNQNPDNGMYHTPGGAPTWEKVFLLSIDEAYTYFRTDQDRRAAPTPYAKAGGSFVSDTYKTSDGAGTGWWWLRSPGGSSLNAAGVYDDGGVYGLGFIVGFGDVSVRPALWLNL